jgi:hypothetical protein
VTNRVMTSHHKGQGRPAATMKNFPMKPTVSGMPVMEAAAISWQRGIWSPPAFPLIV